MAIIRSPFIGTAIMLAVLCTAGIVHAQTIPRTGDFGDRLPEIPLTVPVTPSDVLRQALPRAASRGYQIAPGVIVDRLARPRCVFIANQNQGSGSVRQSTDIGRVQMYCP